MCSDIVDIALNRRRAALALSLTSAVPCSLPYKAMGLTTAFFLACGDSSGSSPTSIKQPSITEAMPIMKTVVPRYDQYAFNQKWRIILRDLLVVTMGTGLRSQQTFGQSASSTVPEFSRDFVGNDPHRPLAA